MDALQHDQPELIEASQPWLQAWHHPPPPRLCLLRWSSRPGARTGLQLYAQALASQLNADLLQMELFWRGPRSLDRLACAAEHTQADLLIFQLPHLPLQARLPLPQALRRCCQQIGLPILVPQRPRWPIAKLLILAPGSQVFRAEDFAWGIQLAQSLGATVQVTPLLPPVAGMFAPMIRYDLPTLLASHDPLGRGLRRLARQLDAAGVPAEFCLQPGAGVEQVRAATRAFQPDLIALPRCVCDLATPLLLGGQQALLLV